MPISAKVAVNTQFIEDTLRFADEFEGLVQEAGREIMDPIIPQMLEELRQYPGPPNYPIKWTSAKQRKKVMILLRQQAIERGDFVIGPRGGKVVTDLRYQRTGKFGEGWSAEVIVKGTTVIMKVGNPFMATEFIVGTLNFRSLNEARLPQQPFHADRWQLAAETVRKYFLIAENDMRGAVNAAFEDFVIDVKRRSRR